MKIGVRLKIDVSKIDKTRLFKGQKGVYLDATAFIDISTKDKYDNNGMITQDVTKDEKEAGKQGAILGNTQVFWTKLGEDQPRGQQQPQAQSNGLDNDFDSDIPF